MGAMLPLPHFKSEGLEDGKGKHREGATDGADADNFFLSLCHTAGKGKKELGNFYVIRHKFLPNIPKICKWVHDGSTFALEKVNAMFHLKKSV
jgi:hypothetical protein